MGVKDNRPHEYTTSIAMLTNFGKYVHSILRDHRKPKTFII